MQLHFRLKGKNMFTGGFWGRLTDFFHRCAEAKCFGFARFNHD